MAPKPRTISYNAQPTTRPPSSAMAKASKELQALAMELDGGTRIDKDIW